jgi:hypothetical protein
MNQKNKPTSRIKVEFGIIEHPADKVFPEAAYLRLEFPDGQVFHVCDWLVSSYREGDVGFQPKHLSHLFLRMGRHLRSNMGYKIKNEKTK